MGKAKSKKHQKKTTQPVRKPKALTRKEQRKEQRKLFKQEKHIFHLKKHGKTLPEIAPDGPIKPEHKVDPVQRQKEKDAKKKEKDEKFKKAQDKQRKLQMELANQEEEQTIKKLEKQLKLNKRKTKGLPASFKEDGLDYLLDVLDADTLQNLGSDDESDLVNTNYTRRHLLQVCSPAPSPQWLDLPRPMQNTEKFNVKTSFYVSYILR